MRPCLLALFLTLLPAFAAARSPQELSVGIAVLHVWVDGDEYEIPLVTARLLGTGPSGPPSGPLLVFPVGAPTAIVRGTVTRAGDGQPIAGARMTLFTTDLAFFREQRTDALGEYRFRVVPEGSYRLGAAALGRNYSEDAADALGGSVLLKNFTLAEETEPGQWDVIGNTLPETLDATDIAFLRTDGKVFYCHDTSDPILFDPVTGNKTFPPGSGSEQGCTNGTLLADGSLILVGGQTDASPGSFMNAIPWVKLFPPSETWQQLGDMLAPNGRWYPGLARLNDGRLLVMGGGTAPSAVRTNTCEIFAPDTQAWTPTGSMGSAVEFPPCALLYTGQVLRTWGTNPELFDPDLEQWTPTGAFNFPTRGFPGHSDHSLLVLSDGRAAAVGVSRLNQPTAAMVEYFDADNGTWSLGTSPSLVRMQAEVVYLPDGRVLVQGGDQQTTDGPEPNVLGVVRRCDVLDPTLETWRRVADTPIFREYHAVTLLLPDGRVCTTGGTNIKFQTGPTSADIDAYRPPYLFRGVRPQISNLLSETPARGDTLQFDIFPRTTITSAVLMGVPSTTHWVDAGIPRRLELDVDQAGSTVTVVLPTKPNLLPLGWYLLFAMVDDIPSDALILRVLP